LNKLSHSKIRASFLGAQIVLNIDNTATGSVAEINTQNNKQIINGISNPTKGKTKNKPNAISIAEINKPNIAKAQIVFQLLIICL
jgi:4-hydroxy-L-threonine phosphate dehydrogenase PdxA